MMYRAVLVMCLIAFKLLVANPAAAQSFHQLTADDFQGTPLESNRGVIAYTNCTIDFRYQAIPKNGYYSLDFNIRLILNNNKSWMDKNRIRQQELLDEVLKHEQGHYTIAYLEQQELLRQVTRTRFSANYKVEAMSIFNRIDDKYRQLNLDYDEDTQHMVNRLQQNSWDAYFKKRLAYMPPVD